MFNGLHYNSISTYMKARFGRRIVKLSLDGGFTCPNRDGTCGYGGCSFCPEDGSGAFAGSIESQLADIPVKWGQDCGYLAYFQNHTNTYAKPEVLRKLWDDALSKEGVVGLAIATRPDCLGPDILELLSEYNRKTFLWVELGLQTWSDKTAAAFNRGYDTEVFTRAVKDLSTLGIKCVIHLILGLPGEDKAQFMETAGRVAALNPFGIKIHMLHLMEGTLMGESYRKEPFPLLSMEEYVSSVCDILEIMPQSVTIHRLTGDAPREKLIAPHWTENKHTVLNAIQKEFSRRGSYQGIKAQTP